MSVVSVRAWVWCACVSVLCMNTCVCIHAQVSVHGACMLCVHIYVHEVCVVWKVFVVWACVCCVVCGGHVHMDVCMACIVHIPIGGVLCAVCGV